MAEDSGEVQEQRYSLFVEVFDSEKDEAVFESTTVSNVPEALGRALARLSGEVVAAVQE